MRSLLISTGPPSTHFGTGQRVQLLHQALTTLGECRIFCLADDDRDLRSGRAHYWAPRPIRPDAPRARWIVRSLSFADYRPSRRYAAQLAAIHREYPFDVALCSFVATSIAMPTGLVPCFLDVDAFPRPTGPLAKLIWPITKAMLRRRARDFQGLFLIREDDRPLFGPDLQLRIAVVPGISMTARPISALPHQERRNILFVGAMAWHPNRAAVTAMIEDGIPEKLAAKGYRLRLVGEDTDAFGERDGLSGAGFVDDLAAEYDRAALVICPVETPGGANIKLAEAVQSGCAVLASEKAALAYSGFLVPGRHIETYSGRESFWAALDALLDSGARLDELRRNAALASEEILNPPKLVASLARRIGDLQS